MWRNFVIAGLSVFFATTIAMMPLSYVVKRRMKSAGFTVDRFTNAFGEWRLWHSYRDEAPERGWPVWPYYVFVVWMIESFFLALAALLGIGFKHYSG